MTILSSKPIRWGILGASEFASEYMGPAIQRSHNAMIAAVATSDPAKADRLAALAPGLRIFTDYEAMLADPDIDAVYVPLPNHLHVEWSLKALAAGKPVLTEKPIALKEEEFDALIAARDAAGIPAAEGYMVAHHPQWKKARELVQSGAIGKLTHVRGAFCYNNAARPENIRNRPETAGGALRDIGVYPFGTTRFVSGEEPESLTANIQWDNGVDAVSRVSAKFPSFDMDVVVSMRMSPYQEMVFHGDEGLIRLTAPFNPQVYAESKLHLKTGAEEHVWQFTEVSHFVLQVEAFGRAIRGEEPYGVPLEFSRGTQRMIDMAFASAGAPDA